MRQRRRKDGDGEIVTLDAVREALPDYMQWGNIREMHALKAVGVADEANVDTKGLYLTARIVDDAAWKKCVEGVYKGFSIGGRKLAKTGNKITSIDMTEISIVDRPSNPDARFALAKSAKSIGDASGYLVKAKVTLSPEAKALAKMAKVVGSLAKAGPPAAHDGFSLPAKPNGGELGPNDSRPNENITRKAGDKAVPCEAHGKIGCKECAAKAEGKTACKAHGVMDCEKCALEKREFSEGKRNELASSGAALPDGSYPIENVSDLKNAIQAYGRAKDKAKAKAHITARAKALGAESSLPEDWSGGKKKKVKKLAKLRLSEALSLTSDSFLTLHKAKAFVVDDDGNVAAEPLAEPLGKSMGAAGSLAYVFDSIRNAQRSLMMEGKREGGDKKDQAIAKELGTIAKQLASLISQKAEHEGEEATTLTDADDQYLTSYLGDDKMAAMNGNALTGGTGDPLTDAVAALMKRAAMPTRFQRMAMAKDNVKKARKAAKDARGAIEDVHKMLKASYINKAAKKDGKPADGGDDGFDHAEAMGKLQKAYQDIDKARTFGKAASMQIEKAAGRSGQRGEEAGDAEAGFYEVPPGVTDLSPSAMAGAAPGSKSGGSQPPMYPADGSVYAGKAAGGDGNDLRKYAKNGMVSADMAELIMKNAKAEGELEALRRIPAAVAGRGQRPFAFDMTKVMGGTGGAGGAGGNGTEMNKALFDGVDPMALGSGDERAHTEASARVIGNFLTSGHFGKSVFDPAFKGAAGTGR